MPALVEKLFLINMINLLNVPQTIFVILVPTIVVVLVILFLFFLVRNKNQKSNHEMEYYKVIRSIADCEDYYLLNNFKFNVYGSKVATIDHLLVGEKYFYIILSMYYDGNLSGAENDASLRLTTKETGTSYTDNPLFISKTLIQYLSSKTNVSSSFMIGIVLVNDSCQINLTSEKLPNGNTIPNDEKIYFLTNVSKLKNLIKKIESRPIKKLNAKSLDSVIKGLDKLNRSKKKNG